MYISKATIFTADDIQQKVLESMSLATQKLWNIGNYERHHYKDLGLEKFPNWFDQKKRLKSHYWSKALPSHTGQLLLKKLDEAWKSYFELRRTGGVEDPQPPRFKKQRIFIPFDATTAIKREGEVFRFTIAKQERQFLFSTYGVSIDFLRIRLPWFADLKHIKEITIYPMDGRKWKAIAVYEVEEVPAKQNNGRYLSIDLGVKNLATCYTTDGDTFIVGKRFLELNHYFNMQVARYQSISDAQQGVEHPKKSKRVKQLYKKYRNSVNNLLHQSSAYIRDYCLANDINTVIIGDITGIRDGKNLGRTNQPFHALPYKQFTEKLAYKLRLEGIAFIQHNEAYSSQCSPFTPKVGKKWATPKNRVKRGLYKDGGKVFHADVVGAYNILRLAMGQEVAGPFIGTAPRKVSV